MCQYLGRNPPNILAYGIWRTHSMKDRNGDTTCPHLWFVKCGHCGATGGDAHVEKYCPVLLLHDRRLQRDLMKHLHILCCSLCTIMLFIRLSQI
ncbi:hypothetical protein KIN20_029245 [Parelaphostrongylus tenuis]|uniref:Nanos-type domain-containing protein n=1 Tax=Parelaphostrongylus tenuis TaxID=148309 RepID=A0AAD5R2B7_PARTN|nr:hypothetical protein KIN20_029245 [Parelaphostrongylus tenuis]